MTKEQLKQIKENSCLTWPEFSRKIGYPQSTVEKWFNGQNPVPYHAIKIMELLDEVEYYKNQLDIAMDCLRDGE